MCIGANNAQGHFVCQGKSPPSLDGPFVAIEFPQIYFVKY